jgi:hypothetical protein
MEHPEGYNEAIRVSNLEVDTIVKKIRLLSTEEIDNLWFETGWIDSEAEKDNRKALPNWRLEKIKNSREFAEESFVSIITDEPYRELRIAAVFLNNLSKYVKL